jgi:NAD(P)-dependent dehydrogenase (short-subunit alcohol dehydrogenase family)
MTVALITGANSGIGRASAVELARRGWTVYGSMRSLDKAGKLEALAAGAGVTVHPVVCDVTSTGSVNRAVAEVTEAAGGIDVLVNNAGVAANGVTEECGIDLYASVMDVNLYGPIRCTQAVLPQMRERGSGCIVNISSVAGVVAAIAQSPYVASKWAVEGWSEGLAQEVAPFGIRVALIEPGVVRTAILAKNTDAPNASGAYDAHYRRLFAFYAAGLNAPGQPEEVAEVIYAAATDERPRFRYTCGWGGAELTERRPLIDDQDWIALGAIADDAEYAARFEELFALDIAPLDAAPIPD